MNRNDPREALTAETFDRELKRARDRRDGGVPVSRGVQAALGELNPAAAR